MKTSRILVAVSSLAFIAGFWSACSIGFDIDENKFSCMADTDCISPNQCVNNICVQRGGPSTCVDADDDGYGTGDVADCAKCQQEGDCREDCNDNDQEINPGLLDSCDGKDNNCNEEIDEPLPCEDFSDCPDEQPYLPSCNTGTGFCEYKPPNQLAAGCNMAVACVNGERSSPGDQCF